jgi:hypothetical protein
MIKRGNWKSPYKWKVLKGKSSMISGGYSPDSNFGYSPGHRFHRSSPKSGTVHQFSPAAIQHGLTPIDAICTCSEMQTFAKRNQISKKQRIKELQGWKTNFHIICHTATHALRCWFEKNCRKLSLTNYTRAGTDQVDLTCNLETNISNII